MDDVATEGAMPPEEKRDGRHYNQMIADAEKAFDSYQSRCDSIDKLYASLDTMAKAVNDREFKIFWANMEVLRPTIYSRPPQPVVQPRHRDGKELHRKASEMLERVLEMDVEADDLHETLKLVRDDLAIASRGVPWVLDTGECIHVNRRDFIHDPARKWSEVGWVARRAFMSKKGIKKRFPDCDVTKLKFEEIKGDGEKNAYKTSGKKAQVWELWHRGENRVVWVTPDYEKVLDESEPLFDVKGFFPCPRPAYGTLERETLKPVPDFVYYRDQVDEINEFTARISSLAESLRLKGFYAAGASEVGEAIEAAMKATDNKAILVPVSSAAAFGNGALKDAIVWLPVKEVAEVIRNLIELRRELIDDVYEISGLSDIMRGATDPNETLGAQNLKAQFGSVRVRERQGEMARIAVDILRIKAEVYAEEVPADDLLQMAGMTLDDVQEGQDPVTVEMIDALLKDQRLRPFVLEVESDSTIAPNEEAEKQSRIEFTQAAGQFIQQAGAMVAQEPRTAPLAAEFLKFMAGGFRAGRELGAVIDDFANEVKEAANEQINKPQEPSPEQQKVMMEMEESQARLQNENAELSAKIDELSAKTQHVLALIEKTQAETDKIRVETAKIAHEPEAEHVY